MIAKPSTPRFEIRILRHTIGQGFRVFEKLAFEINKKRHIYSKETSNDSTLKKEDENGLPIYVFQHDHVIVTWHAIFVID